MTMFTPLARWLAEWFTPPDCPKRATLPENQRSSQQMFYFGRTVAWLKDRPGWFVAETEHNQAGVLEAVAWRQLSPTEVALLKTLYPNYWGQLGTSELAPKEMGAGQKLMARLRNDQPQSTLVEFWALYFDPRVGMAESMVGEVDLSDPSRQVGV